MKRIIVVAAIAALFAGIVVSVDAQDAALLNQVYYSMVSGTITKALELLNAAEGELTEEGRTLKQGLTRRFLTKTEEFPTEKGLFGELLSIHRSYWLMVLTGEWSVEHGKKQLYNNLRQIAKAKGKMYGEFTKERYDELSKFLMAELEKDGIHSTMGTTHPHGDIIAWKTQYDKEFEVSLPEGTIEVKVIMMDDFVSLGWIGFVTLERHSAGGWAKEDVLYAVASKYDFESEGFKVSYLAHEARHQMDFQRYPKIEDGGCEPELEYRAKLTELIMSRETTHKKIIDFQSMAQVGREASHAHASYYVIKNIWEIVSAKTGSESLDWETIPADSIRQAALTLLNESTKIMESWGPDKVEQFLELQQ